MAGIFLSYAREDRTCAERLTRVLENAGHRVWWDRHIASGLEFAAEIESQLESADLILVAWSAHAAKSPWVRDEAAIGRDKGRLLPVLVDGSQPPIGFRQFQALDLTGWRGRENDSRSKALLAAVDAVLGGAPPVVPPAGKVASFSRRSLLAAAVCLALLVVAVATLLIARPGRAEAEPASLAVLPFKNLAGGNPYFAEGVAEEIMNQLAREPQFKVAGRTSSALFKDAADLRDVGRRLRVAYILEGSVRSAGNQVRVDVALVDTRKGMRTWSQNFRGSLDDIFAIQESIGQQVAANLKRQLVHAAAPRGSKTTRGDVYSLYVTARSLIRTRQPAKLDTAVELLQRATKLDPNYAPAWARLAQATRMSRFYGHENEPGSNRVRPDEIRYAERAIALAPNVGEGHAVLGLLLGLQPELPHDMRRRGRAAIERAVKLDSSDAEAWYWLYIMRETDLDFEGALAAVRKTAEIDPFFTFADFYPSLAWEMGDAEAALNFWQYRYENHPDPYIRQRTRMIVASARGDFSGAYQHLKKTGELARPDMRHYSQEGMGFVLARAGLFEEARRYLPKDMFDLLQGRPPPADDLAQADPVEFWSGPPVALITRLLINSGRTAEVVSLYDRAFAAPEAMATRLGKLTFVQVAPIAAAALREVGRHGEASQLLGVADRLCNSAIRRGRTPVTLRVNCSRSWAMLRRGDQAIRTLERAIKLGWRPGDGWSYRFTDEPVYRSIRDDPRLRRLGQFVLAENARERRELLAAGV